ncbi:MAG: outer membrane protein assembly factor BamC [Massilia sp.]|nr:outer membrane protein assembly factor BamC [Aquabacterium sp.]
MLKTQSPLRVTALSLALIGALSTTGCSSVSNVLAGDKVDYRSSGVKTVNLDVPPDLTQLSGQSRYGQQAQPSTVSASSMAIPDRSGGVDASATVAAPQTGLVKLERSGQNRWLSVALPPEKVWEQVKSFWLESGFELPMEQANAGLMETNWSENRAKLPQSGVRKLLGGILDSLYDTGERDQFRTRIERTAQGSEIYITHRGTQEVYEDARKDQTKWVPRPADTSLEAEMLSRLMLKLGAPKDTAAAAKASVAAGTAAPAAPARVRLEADGVSLAADDDFATVWRRVGLALDRGGFTIEDRDRSQGTYEIRLAPSNDPAASKPGFFSRLFGSSDVNADGLKRYRVQVSAKGINSAIKVLNTKGQAETSDAGRRITKQLLDELS